MNTTRTPVRVARGSAPDSSYSAAYSSIVQAPEYGDAIELVRIQGIAAAHSLYLWQDTGLAVYVHAPDSGPVEALRTFAAEERNWPSWKPTSERWWEDEQELYDRQLWVLEQATREVMLETGTEVEYRD